MAKSTKTTYKPAKKGNYKSVVRMAEGGNVSELDYSERREYIEENYAPFITDAQMIFSIYDSGIEYDYKGDRKQVTQSIIEQYKSLADYTESTLPQETIYEIQDWDLVRKEIDPDTDEVIGETPLEQVSSDNTYNFSYNGLVDLNWRVYHDEEYDRFFYVIMPHLGGDIRGNYGDAIILEGNDKEELFYRFYEGFISGGASIYIKFKDGSEIGFDSEQDSDVFYFRVNEVFEPTGMAQKYLNDFEKFDSWKGDEFLEETIDIYLARNGVVPMMMAGGSLNDENPMAYIQILGYDEGKYFNLTDYADGQDVINGIYEWMNGLNEQFGGNREEYEVTDYEGFGDDLYDAYMGENEFDEIIEAYEKYQSSDFPADVISAYKNDSGSRNDSLSDVIDEMDNNYFGKYENLKDFGYEMVQQGVYEPSENDVYITDTDKRIIAGEEADSKVDDMRFEDLMDVALDTQSDYENEKSELEDKISEIQSEIDDLTDLQSSVDDDDEYETIAEQIEEKEVELDDVQNELDNIDSRFEDEAREEARELFYDEIYNKLENDLEDWLYEYGYNTGNLADVSFLSIDYEKIGDELSSDYLIVEFDGSMYFFNNYSKGGRIMASKIKPKFDYYIVENNTKKLVSGYSTKGEAIEQRKLLVKEYPSMRFEIFTLGNLEKKTDLDVYAKKDYVELSTLDKIKKVSVDAYRYGKEKVEQTNEFLKKHDVKGRIKRGARKVADKTKQGAYWLKRQWREADFGDGTGRARFFADGGEAGGWKIGDKFRVLKGVYGDYNSPRYANQEFEVINIREGKYIDARNKRGNTETFDAKNIEKLSFADGGGVHTMPNGEVMLNSAHYNDGGGLGSEIIIKSGNNGNIKVVYHAIKNQRNELNSNQVFEEEKSKGKSVFLFVNNELYDEFIADGDENKYADGGGVAQLPPKGELTNKDNLLLKYQKNGSEYEFYIYEPVTKNVSAYQQNKYLCKNKDCPIKMTYNQFINYLYTETYLDDLEYENGGGVDFDKINKANEIYREHNLELKEKGIEQFSKESAELWDKGGYDERLKKLNLTFEEKLNLDPKKWYSDGGGVSDRMTYKEMKEYEKGKYIHYNPMGSRWEVWDNGELRKFWNQEKAQEFAGIEYNQDEDSRYSRKRYESLFGYSDGGGVESLKVGSKVGFLRPRTGRYEYAEVLSIDGNNVNLVVRHPKRSQWDNYFTETKERITKFLNTPSEDWKDGRPVFKVKYADGGSLDGELFKVHYLKVFEDGEQGDTVFVKEIYGKNENEAISKFKKTHGNYKIEYVSKYADGGGVSEYDIEILKKKYSEMNVSLNTKTGQVYVGGIKPNNKLYSDDKGYYLIDGYGKFMNKKYPIKKYFNHLENTVLSYYMNDKFKKGGETKVEYDVYDNKRMLLNQANEIEHHSEELSEQVKLTKKVPAWVVAKMERATTDLSDITHYLDGENKMAHGGNVVDVTYEVLPHINKFIVAKVTYKQHEDYTYPSKEFIYGFNDKLLEFDDIKSAQKFIDNIVIKYPFGGVEKASYGAILLASQFAQKQQPQQIVYYIPQQQQEPNTGIIQNIPEMANGGDVGYDDETINDFCITNLIELANELQSVRYYVTNRFKESDFESKTYKGRLTIVFKEPASINVINSLSKFLERAEDCHHIFEQSVNVSGSEANGLSINLLSDKFSDFEFGKGGKVYDFAPKKINISKTKKITTHLGDFNLALITKDFVYFVNMEESDENGNTMMYNKNGELLSDNYFASNELYETLEKESAFDFIHPMMEIQRQEILKEN
jgi:hypothetical protein